jgi:drug/metabolite transporter superfamily protein YnfA
MFLPTLVFVLFALCSSVGAYLLLSHYRSRRVGWVGALLTLLFFAALLMGLLSLFRQGGIA